jgi:hypothetical protein
MPTRFSKVLNCVSLLKRYSLVGLSYSHSPEGKCIFSEAVNCLAEYDLNFSLPDDQYIL